MGEYTFSLLDIDYVLEEKKPVIRIFGRTDKGQSIVAFDRGFEPYFYAYSKEPEKTAERLKELKKEEFVIEKVKIEKKLLNGKEVKILKVVMQSPTEVPSAREAVKHVRGVEGVYEADILFARRYLFDNGLMPMVMISAKGKIVSDAEIKKNYKAEILIDLEERPKNTDKTLSDLNVMSFDIEVYNPKGAPDQKIDYITMLSLKDGKIEKLISTKTSKEPSNKIEKVSSEAEIIKKFAEIVNERDVDILVGYNSDQFDLEYIRNRMERVKYEVVLGRTEDPLKFKKKGLFTAVQTIGRVHIDLFHYASYILRGALGGISSRTLENVAQTFLGEGKKEIDWKVMWKYWDEGDEKLDQLFEYALHDSVLTWKLANVFLPKVYEIAKLVKIPVFDAIRTSYGQLVENYLIWNAHERNEIAPNRPDEEERDARYELGAIEGAYVKEPKKGMYENIALLDFRSLYPTIIISHNIDPSTINCDCCKGIAEPVPETKNWFCKKRRGLIPDVLEKIIDRRVKVKEHMKKLDKNSEEYKELDNEQYALKILANSAYGYLAYRNARWYSRSSASSVTALGRMYIKKIMDVAENEKLEVIYGDTDSLFAISKEGPIEDRIKNFLKKINSELPRAMELELEGIYKRGIFVSKKRYALADKNGKTTVKGLEFVRRDWSQLAKDTQKKVLEALLDKGSSEKAFEIVREVINRLKEGRVTKEDLVVYTALTRPLEKYEVTAPHIAVAKILKKKGEDIKTGSSIGYIIIKGEGKISERARPVDEVDFKKYDKDYYIEHEIIPAVSRVMEALGYEEGALLGKKQFKLTHF